MSDSMNDYVAPAAASKPNKRPMIIGAIVALVGAFGYLAYGGVEDNLVYFLTPSELVAKGGDVVGRPVRLGGQVVPGSVEWNAETLNLKFQVTDGSKTVPVYSSGAPPQMFRAGIGVVVEGKMGKNGTFDSKSLMVKHSNEYRPPASEKEAHEKAKTLIKQQTP